MFSLFYKDNYSSMFLNIFVIAISMSLTYDLAKLISSGLHTLQLLDIGNGILSCLLMFVLSSLKKASGDIMFEVFLVWICRLMFVGVFVFRLLLLTCSRSRTCSDYVLPGRKCC